MKKIINLLAIIAAFIIYSGTITAQETSFTDSRDGKEYKIIYVGKQVWMGQNLNFETENSWAYENKKRNTNQYGRLYTYDAAKNACPAGWHLPTDKEWQELINFYGGDLEAGLALRIDGTSAFNAEYAGFMNKDGEFLDMGHDVNFWTATNCDDQDAWRCYIDRGFNSVVQDYFSKSGGLSVRCLQNIQNNQTIADKSL
jgi:uncharacterized protein (TIGR02145 family)